MHWDVPSRAVTDSCRPSLHREWAGSEISAGGVQQESKSDLLNQILSYQHKIPSHSRHEPLTAGMNLSLLRENKVFTDTLL